MEMENTYWKAILYSIPEESFKVVVSDEDYPESFASSVYSFCNGTGGEYKSGLFAIRKTKEEAIEALKNHINKQIVDAKNSIKEMEGIIKIIEI